MGERERVFIAEDDSYDRKKAVDALEAAGHVVVFQAEDMQSAQIGVGRAAELGTTVGVLDGNLRPGDLSGRDGRTLAGLLKEAVPGIKIISYSGSVSFGDVSVDKSDWRNKPPVMLARAVTNL